MKHKKPDRKRLLRISVIVVIALIAIVGIAYQLVSRAATPFLATEAETSAAVSMVISDSTASAGKSVKFGSTPATNTKVPVLGLSGLPWNAGVFYENGDLAAANAFGTWRGRPVDSIMYFTGRGTWTEMNWLHDDLTAFKGYRVVALPTQPTNMDNSSTAAGANNAFWEQYGKNLTAKGWNDGRTILRLNWENNLPGNPYAANKPNPATFIAAYRNVVNSVRKTAPKTLFNICWNKGPDQAGSAWTAVYPGDDYVDILGLDWYDHWNPMFTDANYQEELNKSGASGASLAAFARQHNKKVWLDEWSVSHWPGAGGNDNPKFIEYINKYIRANLDVVVGETTYNDPGAPSSLNHVLYPRDSGNPNASDKYKQLW